MGLFGRKSSPPVFSGPPEDPKWVKSSTGKYTRLIRLDPEKAGLSGVSGVVVIWHAGVKPRWVYVGYAADIAAYLHEIGNNRSIMDYEVHGGLYVTWSLIKSEFQGGVVKYLTEQMKPLIKNPVVARPDIQAIPVLTPTQSQV